MPPNAFSRDEPDNGAQPDAFVADEVTRWRPSQPESRTFSEPSPETQSVACWRCEKQYESRNPVCPWCAANNRSLDVSSAHSKPIRQKSPAIVRVVWSFAVLAAVSLLFALASALLPSTFEEGTEEWAREVYLRIGVLELFSTLVIWGSYVMIPVRPEWPQPSQSQKLSAWLMAIPLLALVLSVNLAYHWWLRAVCGVEDVLADLVVFQQLWPWFLLTICIQPAVMEEVFFRHIALGASLEVTPGKQAVFLSALLFAMAHLGTPLSIPTLTLLGIVLGMLRLSSGGLILPILFHFFHNLLIVLLEPFL